MPGRWPSSGYWEESREPLASLWFVTPWLLIYEGGVLWLGPHAARNGADLWLRCWLEYIGLGNYFLLPLGITACLLAWHYVRRDSWRVRPSVLVGMAAESLCWALGLLILAQAVYPWLTSLDQSPRCALGPYESWSRFITYCGAGLYEELLFRLVLVPAITLTGAALGLPRLTQFAVAIAVSSLLFAAVHYQVEVPMENVRVCVLYGEAFRWSSFLFRFLAGAIFAVTFLWRGFGVTVGAHAVYDILAAYV
jgi:membrane protease YdiL (CAAX protease family)